LKNFKGTWRRLEFKGETIHGALVYDDYAHHPSEIKSSLLALKEKYSDKKKVFYFIFLFLKYKLYFNLAINRHKNICERIFFNFFFFFFSNTFFYMKIKNQIKDEN
jgi:hypothetical protein